MGGTTLRATEVCQALPAIAKLGERGASFWKEVSGDIS